jgi:hypothetical protein
MHSTLIVLQQQLKPFQITKHFFPSQYSIYRFTLLLRKIDTKKESVAVFPINEIIWNCTVQPIGCICIFKRTDLC